MLCKFDALPTSYVWIRVYPQSVRKRNKVMSERSFHLPFQGIPKGTPNGVVRIRHDRFSSLDVKKRRRDQSSAKKFQAFLGIIVKILDLQNAFSVKSGELAFLGSDMEFGSHHEPIHAWSRI